MLPDPSVEYRDLHWTATDGTQMAGRQWLANARSEEAGPNKPLGTVLIVHGMGDHSGRYEPMATSFAKSGWSVFAPDLRGHGRTSGARGYFPNMEILHSDLQDCLLRTRQLAEGQPVFLYGPKLWWLARD